ncbi:MAG: hypothetical protein J6K38_00900 [Alistipes sp.]|nr:hypothetical protein [Alistipes sp.]
MKKSTLIATIAGVSLAVGCSSKTDVKHEAVDLGLSVKWATCNVGASSPSDYGDYFAWGEITPKADYTQENSNTFDKNMKNIAGNPEYDAACANWGGSWRMPTQAEMEELVDNCTWTWTSRDGHNGYEVTSKINGNSIFLPAAGLYNESSLDYAGVIGGYWSSTPFEIDTQYARILDFASDDSGDLLMHLEYRNYGYSVRPVSE